MAKDCRTRTEVIVVAEQSELLTSRRKLLLNLPSELQHDPRSLSADVLK